MTNGGAEEDSKKRGGIVELLCVLETPVGRDHHRRMREEKRSQDYIDEDDHS